VCFGNYIKVKSKTMDDDYFASLGGSLMKDLLADLAVEDGDFSLEQLERELSTLESSLEPQRQLPGLSAASLVVSHALERSAGTGASDMFAQSGTDAWSLSLEKFNALSLGEDFLAADTVRKQHTASLAKELLETAEEYDIAEKSFLSPPPGLGGGGILGALQQQLIKPDDIESRLTQPASLPEQQPPALPNPKQLPKTPQNSLVIPDDEAMKAMAGRPGLEPSVEAIPAQQDASSAAAAARREVIPLDAIPRQQGVQGPPTGSILVAGVIPQQQSMAQSHPMPPFVPGNDPNMPPHNMAQQPVPVAMPAMGQAWQTRVPMPPPKPAYCNPHPAARPIPAAALESSMMKSRDIAYVIHAILKPILAEGMSDRDYFMQFLQKRAGPQMNPANNRAPMDMDQERISRATKAKEWSNENAVLGHVAKANVARPRALIATAVSATEDSEQRQRASLWKARIYVDQAYQSFQAVVEIWAAAPPGAIPPQVQMHLMKLMKCLGITLIDKEYIVDGEALKFFVKLPKGRTLFARILEKEVLYPNAVQALLPVALDMLLSFVLRKEDDASDDRLFGAISRVVHRLNLTIDTVLASVNSIQANARAALSSQARMQCVHALLQKGAMVAAQEPSEEIRAEWKQAEDEFMKILQGA
jgi:hypothetical protein